MLPPTFRRPAEQALQGQVQADWQNGCGQEVVHYIPIETATDRQDYYGMGGLEGNEKDTEDKERKGIHTGTRD